MKKTTLSNRFPLRHLRRKIKGAKKHLLWQSVLLSFFSPSLFLFCPFLLSLSLCFSLSLPLSFSPAFSLSPPFSLSPLYLSSVSLFLSLSLSISHRLPFFPFILTHLLLRSGTQMEVAGIAFCAYFLSFFLSPFSLSLSLPLPLLSFLTYLLKM